jgi:TP901 family phage tail tape measure protein
MAGGVDIGTLKGKVILEDEYSSKMDLLARKTQDAVRVIESSGPAIKGLATGLAVAAGAAIKLATDFNRSMANVATIIPNNIARINELKDAVQEMAVATGKSTDDLADGLYQIVSTFGDTADTIKILDITARAAAAGLATTSEAINLAAAVTKGYGDTSAEAVQHAADLAFQTTNLGITTFPELAASIGRVIPLAATLGVKQEELFAGFTTLTGITGSTAEVSTQLASVLTAMVKPTDEMQRAMKQLGYESASTMIQQKGLVGGMRELIGTTDGSQESIAKLFGRVEALTASLALTSTQAESFDKNMVEMQKVSGAAAQAFEQQANGVNAAGFAYGQFRQRVITAMQDLGDIIITNLPKPLAIAAQGLVETGSKLIEYSGQIAQVVIALQSLRGAQLAANSAVAAAAAPQALGGLSALLAGGASGAAAGASALAVGLTALATAAAAGTVAYVASAFSLKKLIELINVYSVDRMKNSFVQGSQGYGGAFFNESKKVADAAEMQAKAGEAARLSYAKLVEELKKVQAEVATFTPLQRQAIDAQSKLGKSAQDIADMMNAVPYAAKVSVEAITLYTGSAKEAATATKKVEDEIGKLAQSMMGLGAVKEANTALEVFKRLGDAKLIDPAKAAEMVTTLETAIDTVKRLGLAASGATAAQVKGWEDTLASVKPVAKAYEKAQQEVEDFSKSVKDDIKAVADRIERGQELTEATEELTVELKRAKQEVADRAAWRNLSDDWRELLEQSRQWEQDLEDMADAAEKGDPALRAIRMEIIATKRENFDQKLSDMAMETDELQRALGLAYLAAGQFGLGLTNIAGSLDDVEGGAKKARDRVDELKDVFSGDIGAEFGRSLVDGIAKVIDEGGSLSDIFVELGRNATQQISKGIAAQAQSSLGGIMGGIVGAGAGFVLAAAYDVISGYITQEEDKAKAKIEAMKMRNEIRSGFGGSDRKMTEAMDRAGVSPRSQQVIMEIGDPEQLATSWAFATEQLQKYQNAIKGLAGAAEGAGDIAASMGENLAKSIESQAAPIIAAQEAVIAQMKKAGATSEEVAAKQAEFAKQNEDRIYQATDLQVEQVNRLGTITGGVIANLVGRTGDLVGSVLEAGPAVEQLIAARDNFGLGEQLSAATLQVIDFYEKVKNNADAFNAISGVGKVLDGFGEAMITNSELFNALGEELEAQALTLESRGLSVEEIYASMAPQLQKLWEAAQSGKVTIDETTASLLAQAEAQGVVGDSMRSVDQQVLGVMTQLRDMFSEVFDVAIPRAVATTRTALGGVADDATSIGKAVKTIPDAVDEATKAVVDGTEEMSRSAKKRTDDIEDNFKNCWDTSKIGIGELTEEGIDLFEMLAEKSGKTVDEVIAEFKKLPKDFPIDITWEIEPLVIEEPKGITIPVDYELPEGWQSATTPGGSGSPTPSFREGTNGYENFGDGTLAILHGNEKVTPYGAESGRGMTVVVEMEGQPWIRYTAENIGDFVRLRSGTMVTVP